MITFGLDFGTTNSSLAICNGENVEIVDINSYNTTGKTLRSVIYFDENVARNFESGASNPQKRLNALAELKKAGIKTYGFIGPVMPEITKLRDIFSALKDKVNIEGIL